MTDRITVLENKLDRLLSALSGRAPTTPMVTVKPKPSAPKTRPMVKVLNADTPKRRAQVSRLADKRGVKPDAQGYVTVTCPPVRVCCRTLAKADHSLTCEAPGETLTKPTHVRAKYVAPNGERPAKPKGKPYRTFVPKDWDTSERCGVCLGDGKNARGKDRAKCPKCGKYVGTGMLHPESRTFVPYMAATAWLASLPRIEVQYRTFDRGWVQSSTPGWVVTGMLKARVPTEWTDANGERSKRSRAVSCPGWLCGESSSTSGAVKLASDEPPCRRATREEMAAWLAKRAG